MEAVSQEQKREILRKMTRVRSQVLTRYPFYGHLLMHLQMGLVNCGTACTDMKHLLFDPAFAERLSDEEMQFVMLHEVLHCSLSHCLRGKGLHPLLFNIATDIVVNSNILLAMGVREFTVDGDVAMHKTPDRREGYLFSAEEVYRLLLERKTLPGDGGHTLDSHDSWKTVEETDACEDFWKSLTREAARKYSAEELPPSIRDYVQELSRESQVDWRAALHDFIQIFHDSYDYSFFPSDKRYAESDYVMPAFAEQEGERLERLWFCVDTSGSVSMGELSDVLFEIRQALLVFNHLSGMLSFFDTGVSEPVPFESVEELLKITPVGGGGTSFGAIFRYLPNFSEEERPTAIIVLTDGYALYPPESLAEGIPVLWIIYNNPEDPPWGRVVHIVDNNSKTMKIYLK